MAQVAEALSPSEQWDPMVPRMMTLKSARKETQDTFTMELLYEDGVSEHGFLPGQFNMIGALGVGEVPISISGDPEDPKRLIHTIREVGATTSALRKVRVGRSVTVRGPYGRPWPMEELEGRDVILIAGGIGLAPLRPVIYSIMNHRDRYGRFVVLYGARTPEDILFEKELMSWRAQFDAEIIVTVDRASKEWRGNVGVVTKLVQRAHASPPDAVAMVCGPEIMMRFAVKELLNRGVPSSQIYISMERNMKCGIGLCGHCQLRGEFVCRSGPVYRYEEVEKLLEVREL